MCQWSYILKWLGIVDGGVNISTNNGSSVISFDLFKVQYELFYVLWALFMSCYIHLIWLKMFWGTFWVQQLPSTVNCSSVIWSHDHNMYCIAAIATLPAIIIIGSMLRDSAHATDVHVLDWGILNKKNLGMGYFL